jgi:hypothetical protein
VKVDLDTLSTVPDAPPAAGPDRALDPRPPAVFGEDVAVVDEGAADAEDVATPTESPITAHISAAATLRPLLVFDSDRHTFGRCDCLAVVPDADQSGEDPGWGRGEAPAPPEPPAADGPEVALEARRADRVS